MRSNFLFWKSLFAIGWIVAVTAGHTGAQKSPGSTNAWSIVASYTIPGKASGLAYDGTYIYFGIYGVNGEKIYKFDPATGNNTLQCSGPFGDAYGLTFKGPNLVTINQPSSSAQPAQALEFTMTGSQVSTITLPNHYMSGIAFDNGSYWVCTYYPDPGTVYHVNSSGTVLSQFQPPANQPWDICTHGSDLWIADYNANTVYKVSTTGTVIESHASQIPKPSGIVWDGTFLWYCAGELGANSTLYKVNPSGSGTPVISVPVTTHDYGTVTTGSSSTWNCQVQNTGNANLVLNSLGVMSGQPVTTTMTFPATVAPGASVNIPIIYSPVIPGALNTDVYLNSSDPVHPTITIHLTGNAVTGGPHLNIADTMHNWGERRMGACSRWFLTVNNNGNQNLVISSLTFSDSAFSADGSTALPITLTPLQTAKIGIWFHPYRGGSFDETLQIASNDPLQNPFIVHLNGVGVDTVWPIGTPLWTYFITGSFDNSPKGIRPVGDITGDGVDDVVVASEDNFIRCFNGNSSVDADLMWATEIYSGNVYQQNAIAVMNDINGDGFQDVVVGTTGGDRSVRCLSGKTGTPLWRYDTHVFGGGGWVYQVDISKDYNNDGIADVLACAGDDGQNTGPRRVFCLNALTGIPIWICPTEGAVFSVIGVDDFNGDGKSDVVAGATNSTQVQSRVYGISGANGSILWTNVPPGSSVWALLQIDDFTGDGIRDVASGDYSGNVHFHNIATGSRVKTTTVSPSALILHFEPMGDVNKDGHPDFTIGHSGTNAVMINGHDASILWQQQLADKSWNVTNMGDVTWDGSDDMAVGTLYQNNRTYIFDGADGTGLFSAMSNTPIDALDAIPDIVGDQSMELVAGGRSGLLVCLSGGYDSTLTTLPDPSGKREQSAVVWPNPSSGIVHVRVTLEDRADVILQLHDLSGNQINSKTYDALPAGSHIIDLGSPIPESRGILPGMYLLTVRYGHKTEHIKVIIVN